MGEPPEVVGAPSACCGGVFDPVESSSFELEEEEDDKEEDPDEDTGDDEEDEDKDFDFDFDLVVEVKMILLSGATGELMLMLVRLLKLSNCGKVGPEFVLNTGELLPSGLINKDARGTFVGVLLGVRRGREFVFSSKRFAFVGLPATPFLLSLNVLDELCNEMRCAESKRCNSERPPTMLLRRLLKELPELIESTDGGWGGGGAW